MEINYVPDFINSLKLVGHIGTCVTNKTEVHQMPLELPKRAKKIITEKTRKQQQTRDATSGWGKKRNRVAAINSQLRIAMNIILSLFRLFVNLITNPYRTTI